jgi:hypothetical protein
LIGSGVCTGVFKGTSSANSPQNSIIFFTFFASQTMDIHHIDLSSKTAVLVSEVFKRLRLFI